MPPSEQCLCCAPGVPLPVDPAKSVRLLAVGDVDVLCMTDGGVTTKAAWMFNQRRKLDTGELVAYPQISQEDLAANFVDELAVLSFGCTLLRCGGKSILLDTSLGSVEPPIMPAMTRTRPDRDLREILGAVGLATDDVDLVVHTHLHRDHTGWNVTMGDGGVLVPTFGNAKHVIQRAEFAYWGSSPGLRERVKYDEYIKPLEDLGMLQIVDGDCQLTPEITLHLCPGHTPGHQIARICSGGQTAIFVGDALHQIAQIQNPHWNPFFDWAYGPAVASRRDLVQRIHEERALLLSPHFPFPGAGRLELVDGAESSLKFVPETGSAVGPSESRDGKVA